jgi:hypothetical protein
MVTLVHEQDLHHIITCVSTILYASVAFVFEALKIYTCLIAIKNVEIGGGEDGKPFRKSRMLVEEMVGSVLFIKHAHTHMRPGA